ncbi:MAG: DUF368 domain-containing protein [Acidimicrobiales bacterium]|jgi:putative membrane protein|nr:DUF368 domain-containing protein [Acidimicrobiales bacterium]MDP6650487.1 DUF368 domain-containing protein [Acidimicrobiales bacterium]MDP6759552.1 DUF368 domain-containing protein [Acidimicrobiales bacterium]|tara:strand:- start:794 stop:1690 length:897 start_codon:yes stop_codon:yes gene_type:complete
MAAATRVAQGALMGAANIVPGVSGGTIALMFGIYERLIGAIRDGARALARFARGDIRGGIDRLRSVEWDLLLPLAGGALITVVVLAGFLESGLEDHPEAMAGLFLGLVAASIVVSWRLPDWDGPRLALMAAVGVALFAALGWQTGPVADPSPLALFGAGAVAICAMILPGLSGSFLLLMFGMYEAILTVIDDRMIGDAIIFGVGALLGLALFASLLTRLLERHRDTMLAALIGLMVGSLRVLWPWPDGVGVIGDTADTSIPGTGLEWPPAGDLPVPLLLAVTAFAVVLTFDRLARSRP